MSYIFCLITYKYHIKCVLMNELEIFIYFFVGFAVCGAIVIPLSSKLEADKNKIISDYLKGKI